MDTENIAPNANELHMQNAKLNSGRRALGDITNSLLPSSSSSSSSSTLAHKTSLLQPQQPSSLKQPLLSFSREMNEKKTLSSNNSTTINNSSRKMAKKAVKRSTTTTTRNMKKNKMVMTKMGFGILEDDEMSSSKAVKKSKNKSKNNGGKKQSKLVLDMKQYSHLCGSGDVLQAQQDSLELLRKTENLTSVSNDSDVDSFGYDGSDDDVEFMHKDDTEYLEPIYIGSHFDEQSNQPVNLQISVAENRHKLAMQGDILSIAKKSEKSLSMYKNSARRTLPKSSKPDLMELLTFNDELENLENIDPQLLQPHRQHNQKLSTSAVAAAAVPVRRRSRISIGKASTISKFDPVSLLSSVASSTTPVTEELDWSGINYQGIFDDFSFPV